MMEKNYIKSSFIVTFFLLITFSMIFSNAYNLASAKKHSNNNNDNINSPLPTINTSTEGSNNNGNSLSSYPKRIHMIQLKIL